MPQAARAREKMRAHFNGVSATGINESGMRNKIFGSIGFILSLLMLASAWNTNRLFGNGAFESSQNALLVVGGFLLVASVYTFFKKTQRTKK